MVQGGAERARPGNRFTSKMTGNDVQLLLATTPSRVESSVTGARDSAAPPPEPASERSRCCMLVSSSSLAALAVRLDSSVRPHSGQGAELVCVQVLRVRELVHVSRVNALAKSMVKAV